MAPNRSATIFLFIFLYTNVTNSQGVEGVAEISSKPFIENGPRHSRDSNDESPVWMEYEFKTGAGNREELLVTNISVHEQRSLPSATMNWQFLDVNSTNFLFRTATSTLWLHKFDAENAAIYDSVILDVEGRILMFKAVSLSLEIDVVVVLCVETGNGFSLRWYKLVNGKYFQLFWSWPIQKRIKDMMFIQHEKPNKLLLLGEDEIHFGLEYSPIEAYGFTIDFSTNAFYFWLSQRTFMPKAFDIQVCSIYESILLALQGANDIFLYEYSNNSHGSSFREFQTIKSHSLKNFACFESGYLQFLGISGPEAALFHFEDYAFEFNIDSESSFDHSDIVWVKDIKLNTYRDEALLLIQLKNSSVIALAWQGLSFETIELPSNILNNFNLSTITPIPKFGFVSGNQFVKIHAELKNVKQPIQHTVERLLVLQRLLNDSLNRQDRILDETKSYFEKSYLWNPVITGVWNLSTVNATNVAMSDDVIFHSVAIGSTNLTREELELDASNFESKLDTIAWKMDEIDSNLKNAAHSNLTELCYDKELEIFGNINIAGNLSVKNLSIESLNGIDMMHIIDSSEDLEAVEDKKIFDYMDIQNLTIHSMNGIPIENITFDEFTVDFSNIDFSKIIRAHISGHISFSTINGISWENLMKNIVWKNKPMLIPGNTIIEGTVIADNVNVNTINGLLYPEDYVIRNNDSTVAVHGTKSFDVLVTNRLENVGTLNGIDFEDFIILHKDNVLEKEITFENLVVEGSLQVEGEITGLNMKENKLLNETSKISSDVSFLYLNVLGNVTFNTLFMNKRPLHLRDLLLKNEENIEITGTKTFLGNVEIKSNITITSGMVNGHFLDEFVTLDTEQEFPNLTKILSNVTFGNVTFGAIKKLENYFNEITNSNNCLKKIVVFKSPIISDELYFDTLNFDISYEYFTQKLNETFQNITFDNLIVENLIAEEITPRVVNGINFVNLTRDLELSSIIHEYAVNDLETARLNVSYINGMSLDEINQLKDKFGTMLDIIQNGNVSLDTLRVTGMVKANSINGEALTDLYRNDQASVIFKQGARIKNLTILGLINGYNFSEIISDAVLKTDRDIIIDGFKIFDKINCHILNITSVNGHPIENIFDPSKEQVLSGPVTINGSMTILHEFSTDGNIGDVSFKDLMNRFQSMGNNNVRYHGDVQFSDNVTIENLYTNGTIQDRDLDSFLKSVIFKTEDNVTISGTKVFQNSVIFNDAFVVRDKLNDVDLKIFHEKVVSINEPFSIETKTVFKDEIKVEGDLTVESNLETKSIMNVDINELKLNVLYLNRPTYIEATMTLSNVSFQSNIDVEIFNELDMKLLIPLNTEQIIPVEVLRCSSVIADRLQILGRVNGEDLKQIQQNTFMLTGNQSITGHFHFLGEVNIRHNFNPRLVNGIDPGNFISVNTKDSIVGNLLFENPIYFNQTLRVLGYLNGIDPARWEAVAVTANNPLLQIISGRWTVYGNVYFKNGTYGSDILNGTNITALSNILAQEHLEMDAILAEKDMNLASMCDDLGHLRHYAEKQIYEFSAFDYLQVINFDDGISSVHPFELDDLDYLMLSFNTCSVHAFLFNGRNFELIARVPDFGVVEKWSTFRHGQTLYFLTTGPRSCGRSPVNLWRLMNDEFEHVLDLGHSLNHEQVNQNAILMLLGRTSQMRTAGEIKEEIEKLFPPLTRDNGVKIVLEKDQILLTSKDAMSEYSVDRMNDTKVGKYIRRPDILEFKAGLLQKEMLLYYDEEISEDNIFICSNGMTRKKILQTLKAHRPSSFAILNFEGLIQTFLVFVENKSNLRIYEYKGIQGFVYKDSIRMDVDKLASFKIRKYINLARRYCLALIHGNRLTLLEAKMYGEKLDMKMPTCSKHDEL